MSARQLEDFIGVIETAERSATTASSRSTLWSYPTDIFATTRRNKPPPSLSSGRSQTRPSRNTSRATTSHRHEDLLPRNTGLFLRNL